LIKADLRRLISGVPRQQLFSGGVPRCDKGARLRKLALQLRNALKRVAAKLGKAIHAGVGGDVFG
jgi:hypothetical protein